MKTIFNMVLAICLPFSAFCQDITGLWKGTLYNDSTKQYLQYEVVITKDNGKYSGYSLTWFVINDQKYYGIKKLKIRQAKDEKFIIEDKELVANDYPIAPPKNIRQMNVLDLDEKNGTEVLNGIFVTNMTREYSQLTGKINIKKVSMLTQSDLLQYLKKNPGEANLTASE